MAVVIDGTNLLWALHEACDEREITTEIELCDVLGRYFSQTGEDAELIFDGAGPPDQSSFDRGGRLTVIFSGFRTDTDAVIEDKIKASTAPKRLTVVSSDRRLRKAATARKATAIKSEQFWARVLTELRQKQPEQKEPEEKQDGLTDGETEQWMDFFGLEQ
jgi:predicted RNA-binding protein with PIN domain